MKKIIFASSILLALASCGGKSNKVKSAIADPMSSQYEVPQAAPTASSTTYSYIIENKDVSTMQLPNGIQVQKIRYTVEVPIEYSDIALNEIADVIKSQEPIEYVFIEYYLPSQLRNSGNYGFSKRTPTERSTEINYITPPKDPEPTQPKAEVNTPYKGCKVFGAWNMMGAKVIAYQKNGRCYMVNYYGGSNYSDPELYIKTTWRGRTAFKNAEDPADMYVINSNGDLDGYYDGDLATTFSQTTY